MDLEPPPQTRPNWLLDALLQLRHELRLYLHTVLAMTLHPRRAVLEWKANPAAFMNPLGFLGATLGAIGFVDGLLAFVDSTKLPDAPAASPHLMLLTLAAWAAPFAYYLALGVVAFLVLRLFRSTTTLLDSTAIALYAGGGPATLGALAFKAFAFLYLARHPAGFQALGGGTVSDVTALLLVSPFLLYCWALGSGLRAMSDRPVRRWQVVIAVLLAVVIAGIAFGVLSPPGEYGMHPVIMFPPGSHGQISVQT